MANVVRAAVVQLNWTGDKASMLDQREQAARGCRRATATQVMCVQELSYGPFYRDRRPDAHSPLVEG